MKIVILTILLLTVTTQMYASLGNWLMYTGNNAITSKVSLWNEIQYRDYTFAGDMNQLLMRSGINYIANEQSQYMIGYAYILTSPLDLVQAHVHCIHLTFGKPLPHMHQETMPGTRRKQAHIHKSHGERQGTNLEAARACGLRGGRHRQERLVWVRVAEQEKQRRDKQGGRRIRATGCRRARGRACRQGRLGNTMTGIT